MTELEIIDRLRTRLPLRDRRLVVGIFMSQDRSAALRRAGFSTRSLRRTALRRAVPLRRRGTGQELPGLRIGTMNDGPPGYLSLAGYPLEPRGWEHFTRKLQWA